MANRRRGPATRRRSGQSTPLAAGPKTTSQLGDQERLSIDVEHRTTSDAYGPSISRRIDHVVGHEGRELLQVMDGDEPETELAVADLQVEAANGMSAPTA